MKHVLPRILRKMFCSGLIGCHGVFPAGAVNKAKLYLTFDDGPCPKHTPRILELLAHHEVSATFFCCGGLLEKYPDIACGIVKQGHMLGNHTFSHKIFTGISQSERESEITMCQQAIEQFQSGTRLFRPPQGLMSLSDFFWLLKYGYRIAFWTIDSLDSFQTSSEVIETRLKSCGGGNVILFHDDAELCVQVLKKMIPWWKAQGYSFGTID